ncbi:MAG: rSAM/selenodomain-associated transferase 1 [Saprospiraceae bacterium]
MNRKTDIKSTTSIIVFIKNPRLGQVKTRLAKDVGDEKALEIYLQLTAHTHKVLAAVPDVNRCVYYSEFIGKSDDWSEDTFVKCLQSEGDLGDKIKYAFSDVFKQSDKAIIIGSDCAQISADHIQTAINLLENNNVVIGPSLDGGYYLLGIDSHYQFLFEDIKWSTDSVLEDTKSKALGNGLIVAEIETLSDIDYIEDWEKYGLDKR